MSTIRLTKEEVCAKLAVSERTLEGLVRSRRFPEPVRLDKRCYWAEDVVERYLEEQFDAQRRFVPRLAIVEPGVALAPMARARGAGGQTARPPARAN
ncbi:MAG TPA: helix-turn-helix domain-containing protein [Rhodocyclaceae bacterium]|nr:helix-turn-helix domain-containing protein [Rhodocyclaceae bacterium]